MKKVGGGGGGMICERVLERMQGRIESIDILNLCLLVGCKCFDYSISIFSM